jgi:hypothetical protein
LAKYVHIGIEESNLLADFERTIYVNLLAKDFDDELKAMENAKKHK